MRNAIREGKWKSISERGTELPLSTIGELIKIAEEERGIISLGPGEPDFSSPKNVIDRAVEVLREGKTHYSPPAGRKDLREEVSRKLKKENRIDAGPEDIIITTGSTEAILLALMCSIDPGEGVLLPDPGFLAYTPAVEMLNGMPLSVPHRESDGFQFNTDEAERAIIPEKTNVLIINSPSNPTGVVYKKKTMEEIADFAEEHDLFVVSDEAYEKFVYDGAKHVSFASLNGMGRRTLTLHSFSKTYAMPGFRVGYAAGPRCIVDNMAKMHTYTSICAPTVSQIAALEALRGPQGAVRRMLDEYGRRRKMILRRLEKIPGFRCQKPEGAFYVFPNIKEFGKDSVGFSKWLLKKAKVAVVPGTEFGRMGEGFVRCSYATSYKKMEKAMNLIELFCEELFNP